MANFGKGLGAGLEALGAGMIKQGETVGNMMYLTAAADKEAARKSGAAGAKAQHDTMLKYLDRMGSDVDALSKQYVAAITAQDSFLYYNSSGTVTTLTNRSGGNVEFSTDLTRTVTNTTLYAGSTMIDLGKTVTPTNGWDLDGCGLEAVTLQVGKHLTVTPTAI